MHESCMEKVPIDSLSDSRAYIVYIAGSLRRNWFSSGSIFLFYRPWRYVLQIYVLLLWHARFCFGTWKFSHLVPGGLLAHVTQNRKLSYKPQLFFSSCLVKETVQSGIISYGKLFEVLTMTWSKLNNSTQQRYFNNVRVSESEFCLI